MASHSDVSHRSRLAAFTGLIGCLLFAYGVQAAGAAEALQARYQAMLPSLRASPLGLPLIIESHDNNLRTSGEIYGILDSPFALTSRLKNARDWCEIALLHLNIKTCTHAGNASSETLTFYSGRKFYEPPEKAYALHYGFQLLAAQADYLKIVLTAAAGPLNSADYEITFEATPVGNETFIHFAYGFRSSLQSRLATDLYLATLGREKTGFSVVSTRPNGEREYAGGVRAVVERNVVRYYFAIQAFLQSITVAEPAQFERRAAIWFDLTERYPQQLHELERSEYLQSKEREHQQQIEHQRVLDLAAGAASK